MFRGLILIWMLCSTTLAYAAGCVDAEGDAAIIHGDLSSAKLEAVARAKWAAIEQAVGVQVSATSLVENFELVDDNILKKTEGVIKSYKLLSAKQSGDLYQARIHACVARAKAEASVGQLVRNTAVGVLVVARSRQEDRIIESDSMRYSHEFETLSLDRDPFSVAVKQQLLDQEIQVVDLASTLQMDVGKLAAALDRHRSDVVRKVILQSMANVFVMGQIDNVISTRKGSDIGYGLSMPMHKVTAHLRYKILSRDRNGVVRVIASGSDQGMGMAIALEDANQQAMQSLADHASQLVAKITSLIEGKARVIDVTVKGAGDVDAHREIKDRLNQIKWVMGVQDLGVGHFKVKYLEKTLYLANSLQRIDGVRVRDFSNLSITAHYE